MSLQAVKFSVDKVLAERKLRHFIRQAWGQVETLDFVDGWHLDAISEHLQAVAERKIRRLLINVPPRHMKSLQTGVFFPPWVWAQDPDPDKLNHYQSIRPGTWLGAGTKFLFASYNKDLTVRDNVKARRLISSPWYQHRWGGRVTLLGDQNTKGRYDNMQGGSRLAASTHGALTGEGGDIIVVDDPHSTVGSESQKDRESTIQWWQETLSTRLSDPRTGAFVVIMQRLHERDLAGHILAKEAGWDHLCLPARFEPSHPFPVRSSIGFKDPRENEGDLLWPARTTKESIEELATKLGSYGAAGQLQQRPAPREGGFFKKAWFPIVGALPAGGRAVRRWDLAATADSTRADPDWTVGLRMWKVGDRFYIDRVERIRGTPHDVERLIVNTAGQDGKSVAIRLPQDPGQAGKAQVNYLISKLVGYVVKAAVETGSKETRAGPFAAQCEAGNVFLVEGPWIDAFLTELTGFPTAAHDDQVDAASGAFDALTNPVRQGISSAPSLLW